MHSSTENIFVSFLQEIDKSDLPVITKNSATKNIQCVLFIEQNLKAIIKVIGSGITKNNFMAFYKSVGSPSSEATIADDLKKGVLRDSAGTSFHVNYYYDDDPHPLRAKTAEEYARAVKKAEDEFSGILSGLKEILTQLTGFKRKLFIAKFRYEEDKGAGFVGCLDNQLRPALQWGITRLSTQMLDFADIMYFCEHQFSLIPENKPQDFLEYLLQFCKQENLIKTFYENQEITLSYSFAKKYLQEVLCWEDECFNHDIEHEAKSELNPTEQINSIDFQIDYGQIIQKGHALVKAVYAHFGDDANLDFFIKQFNNPATVRPVRPLASNVDRTLFFNAYTQAIDKRKIQDERGRIKSTLHIKKTSMTFMPVHGKINYYNSYESVLFLFNKQHCRFSQDAAGNILHIYETNATTNNKWFVGGKNPYNLKSTTFENLIETYKPHVIADTAPQFNEVLAKPSKKSFIMIGAPEDTLVHRLNTLRVKLYMEKGINKSLSIGIITPTTGDKKYSSAMQAGDIFLGLQCSEQNVLYKLACCIILDISMSSELADELLNLISRSELKLLFAKSANIFISLIKNIQQLDRIIEILGPDEFNKHLPKIEDRISALIDVERLDAGIALIDRYISIELVSPNDSEQTVKFLQRLINPTRRSQEFSDQINFYILKIVCSRQVAPEVFIIHCEKINTPNKLCRNDNFLIFSHLEKILINGEIDRADQQMQMYNYQFYRFLEQCFLQNHPESIERAKELFGPNILANRKQISATVNHLEFKLLINQLSVLYEKITKIKKYKFFSKPMKDSEKDFLQKLLVNPRACKDSIRAALANDGFNSYSEIWTVLSRLSKNMQSDLKYKPEMKRVIAQSLRI